MPGALNHGAAGAGALLGASASAAALNHGAGFLSGSTDGQLLGAT